MAVPLEKFVKQLEDSGIIAGDTLKDFLPPKSEPKDAEELARELVRKKKLTKFQAEEVSKGKGKSLTLGNYVLMEAIGAGGMGEVYKAEHRRMHRFVAIKVLPASTMKDPATVARFEREVEAVAKISHPNIVSAFDADQANGVHFLVMELVEGNDLSVLVKKYGPLPVEKAVNYCIQAANGLEAAHAAGIVHRDIKPANLLLDKKGTVKILDMGLARIETDEVDAATQAELTGAGAMMGTVDYMSPEQAVDSKTADARADIYSLGCSLHYLLTGKPIYEGDSLMNRMLAHRDKPIPSLCAAQNGVPEQLQAIFKKMVAKKIEDRYQSMTAVIGDLERCRLGNEQAKVFHPPVVQANDSNMTSVVSGASIPTKPIRTNTATTRLLDKRKSKLLLIGSAVVGVLFLLAGLVVNLKPVTELLEEKPAVVRTKPVPVTRVKPPIVAATKEPLFYQTPEFDPWLKIVSSLPVEEQVKEVAKKLQELNPGFDGKVTGYFQEKTPRIENGGVTRIGFVTDNVTDISPVRALADLNHLWCCGSSRAQGQLADLSPLTGMRLAVVACYDNKVSDLSPLAGTTLSGLVCDRTQVSDLSPLKGTPLVLLSCGGTQISDFSILQGMSLTFIEFESTLVSDLSPLKGMPLMILSCDFKPERDTELLRSFKDLVTINHKPAAEFWKEVEERQNAKKLGFQMPGFDQWMKEVSALPAEQQVEVVSKKLVELNPGFDGKISPKFEANVIRELAFLTDNVTDISPVRAISGLKKLVCHGSGQGRDTLSDLSPLTEMKVVDLNCEFTSVGDLSPLKGMKLESLCCWHTPVSDLSPLAGMPIKVLLLDSTKVSDLSPLQGMPLVDLRIAGLDVSDLSPLEGMPLTSLICHGTKVSSLTPLRGMKLTKLYCENTSIADLSPLKGMPLTSFASHHTNVTDLSLLKEMPLKEIWCDIDPKRDTENLRSSKTLEKINSKSVNEFWNEVEGKK